MKKRYSILQNKKNCYFCGKPAECIHEVFYGTANRKLSIEDGCCVYLCNQHHNMSNNSVHFNKNMDLQLKIVMQKQWQEYYNKTKEDFIARYGKSVL